MVIGAGPAIGLGLSVALVIGGVGAVHADQLGDQDRAATAAALTVEQARVDRSLHAQAVRLTGQATAYAAATRETALVAARTALDAAQVVVTVAAPVVGPETASPLDRAVADLAALVKAAPDPSQVMRPPVPPGSPAVELDIAAEPLPAPPPPPEPAGQAAPLLAPPSAAGSPSAVEALDLGVSLRMMAAAEEVTALSVQLQATADAVAAQIAAAEQAAAAAAASATAAAAAAAAGVSQRIAVAATAPNGEIPREVLCSPAFARQALLRCDAAAALDQLNAAYSADVGRSLVVVSTYRDLQEQVAIKATRGWLAAAPGTSNHGLGIAVDFADFGDVSQFDTAAYQWMTLNAGRFGFVHPAGMSPGGAGPQEPWHWEYGPDKGLLPASARV